jgi:pimeloyl-ACP methyl ester carboxylesterase
VFIPGLGGTTRYWSHSIGPLAEDYRVVLVDLLGFGASPKPWTRYSVARHVAELHAALDSLGPITLVGHSLGALLAVAYAARHRKQVENLVLIGMPYFGSEEAAYRYLRSGKVKWGFLYTNVLLVMIACILTRRVFGWLLPYVRRDIPREVAEDLVKHTWRSSTSSLWEVVYRYDAADELRRLSEQTQILMIHGQNDDIAPFAAIKQLADERPGWTLIALKGFDHHPFLRTPHTCLTHIDSLLSGDQP